jgi:hypothetical protein
LAAREAREVSEPEAHAADYLRASAGWDDRDLKILANKRDVPYQSLLKVFLAESLAAERKLRKVR